MDKLPPIPSPPGTAFREFRIRFMPGLFFCVVLVATIWKWRGYVGPSSMVGEVQTMRSTVSAPVSGRLSQLPVVAFQRVKAGQIVCQITPAEPAAIDAQVALARARIDQVRINFDPLLRRQNNEVNFASLRMDWLEVRVQLAASLARTNYLAGELERAKRLQSGFGAANVPGRSADPGAGIASLADVQKAQAAYDEVMASITERQRAVSEIGAILERLLPEELRLDDEIPAGVRAAIVVEERNLQVLESQMAPQLVVATIDGVVTEVQRRAGESVQAGENLLTITAEKPESIIAYLRQPTDSVRMGQVMEVRARGGKRASARVAISDIGPAFENIPSQLLPPKAANSPAELGLPVRLPVPVELSLRPGEIVSLEPVK